MYEKRFSGHQSFPLRKGWLNKYHSIEADGLDGGKDDIKELTVEQLAVYWGVGKNMVDAIKYWAGQTGISDAQYHDSKKIFETLYSNDKFIQKRSTLWLVHWLLCRNTEQVTSYRFFFNHYNSLLVSKDSLYTAIEVAFEKNRFPMKAKKDKKHSHSFLTLDSSNSMKKDIGILFQMYALKDNVKNKDVEDNMLAMFGELELIKPFGKDTWICELEERTSLSDNVFNYCLLDFFSRIMGKETSIGINDIMHLEGSPARIFRMSEREIELRLDKLTKTDSLGEKFSWIDSRGSRAIQINDNFVQYDNVKEELLNKVYARNV
ncbi:hypothetical protein BCS96_09155 [Vibrio breoganii]|uniref:DUF4007 family protein n=1 Tax=Vibrio breoganii TaxID=553239 RepID=UPI000C8384F7|nr:DUF4007 family protein [Vibrio breoganii]PML88775.1 hypothetical protein BCT68_04665 [Vibrio breoganii]PMO99882.1 hypothetical protein BCS96_09155 [Vibrio breoganii]